VTGQRVNLLPAVFHQRRTRRRHRHAWIAVCLGVVAIEGAVAVWVSGRAREARLYGDRVRKYKAALAAEERQCGDLRDRLAQVRQDIRLAERLREKHRWSRWLGSLGMITPERVMLTAVQTEPPQYVPERTSPIPRRAAKAGEKRQAEPAPPARPSLKVRVRGMAADHASLMSLLTAMNDLRAFASVRLEEAQRQKFGAHEGIGFSVLCEW